jgi:hypothetical protein
VAVSLALVNASEPRGPKITNKVRIALTRGITPVLAVRFSSFANATDLVGVLRYSAWR